MAAAIHDIARRAAVLLEAATPDIDPAIRFVEADASVELAELPPSVDPIENTRRFRVVPGDIISGGRWAGPDVELVQQLLVQVRYDSGAFAADHDTDRLLREYFAADQARITATLERPPLAVTWATVPCFGNCRFTRADRPAPSKLFDRIWSRTLVYLVTYILLESYMARIESDIRGELRTVRLQIERLEAAVERKRALVAQLEAELAAATTPALTTPKKPAKRRKKES